MREIGRLSGYEQAGVEYLEIRARLDAKTTPMCRSLHGRIIAVREVRQFVNGYLAACQTGNKEAVKQAWPMWNENRFRSVGIAGLPSGKLVASGIGLPPYHFRCRTITVSYFQVLDAQGRNIINKGQAVTFWDGSKERKEIIAWEHKDRLGRKVTVTEELVKKIIRKDRPVTPEKLQAGLNSILKSGENRLPEAAGQRVYMTENGLVIFLRGNVVTSAYYPTSSLKAYFKRVTIPGTVKSQWRSKLLSSVAQK